MSTETKQLQNIISDFDNAMLVTHSRDGQLRARPMHIADKDNVADLYFVGKAGSEKLQELSDDHRVNVCMQGKDRFLSLAGTATVEHDLDKISSLWNSMMAAWFPDGPSDPTLQLIHIKPEYAELWDMSGTNKLEYLFEAGKALLKGEQIDSSKLKNEKIAL